VKGPPFLFVPSPLPTYVLQRYVGYTYVLNSDEGLTERAQFAYLWRIVDNDSFSQVSIEYGQILKQRAYHKDYAVSFCIITTILFVLNCFLPFVFSV
jgi:hypothetical protein